MFFVGDGKKIPAVIPALFLVIISAFISYSPKDHTINLVRLQRPSSKFIFLNKIIIAPIFKISLCGVRPFEIIELINSIGIEFCKHPFSSSTIVSILKYSLLSPLSRLIISLLKKKKKIVLYYLIYVTNIYNLVLHYLHIHDFLK